MKKQIIFLFSLLVFAPLLSATPGSEKHESVSLSIYEGIRHADDRDYLPVLQSLIANSRLSLDLSLESLAAQGGKEDPVNRLLHALMDAARRGVKVRIFISTYASALHAAPLYLREDFLAELRGYGVHVHYVNPSYDLQDRLLIVDGRWVLEGGLRWTKKDLESSLGSATLTDSEMLAEKKKIRLELLPLWDVEARRIETKEGVFPVPVYLLREMKYFPGMVTRDDGDAMKIYLTLLRKFFISQNIKLTFLIEELISQIPEDTHFARSEAAWQVIKILERLEQDYGLIKIEQKGPERIEVELILPQSFHPSVSVPIPLFEENYAKQLSVRALYAYLVIRLKAQTSGQSPVWLGSEKNVEQDFPMTREKFRMGVEELARKNLIEVFPFKIQGTYSRLEGYEYRYLINRIPTIADKLEVWSRLRDQFGQDEFSLAREMSALIAEDEDPKVIASYLDLMKRYPLEDIQSWSRHISELPARSTYDRLRYLGELLEHETRSTELAVR